MPTRAFTAARLIRSDPSRPPCTQHMPLTPFMCFKALLLLHSRPPPLAQKTKRSSFAGAFVIGCIPAVSTPTGVPRDFFIDRRQFRHLGTPAGGLVSRVKWCVLAKGQPHLVVHEDEEEVRCLPKSTHEGRRVAHEHCDSSGGLPKLPRRTGRPSLNAIAPGRSPQRAKAGPHVEHGARSSCTVASDCTARSSRPHVDQLELPRRST